MNVLHKIQFRYVTATKKIGFLVIYAFMLGRLIVTEGCDGSDISLPYHPVLLRVLTVLYQLCKDLLCG